MGGIGKLTIFLIVVFIVFVEIPILSVFLSIDKSFDNLSTIDFPNSLSANFRIQDDEI